MQENHFLSKSMPYLAFSSSIWSLFKSLFTLLKACDTPCKLCQVTMTTDLMRLIVQDDEISVAHIEA